MDLKIESLRARPELLPTVAGWIYRQWWTEVEGASVASLDALLRESLAPSSMPLTLVACYGDTPVGTVTVLAHDVGTENWATLSPWLAALYVVPAVRRRGAGAALIEAALSAAASCCAGSVYLLTLDQEPYYARLGWRVHDRANEAVAW